VGKCLKCKTVKVKRGRVLLQTKLFEIKNNMYTKQHIIKVKRNKVENKKNTKKSLSVTILTHSPYPFTPLPFIFYITIV
jgi:hypothetical protein